MSTRLLAWSRKLFSSTDFAELALAAIVG